MPKIAKIKRCNVAGSIPVLSFGELGWNSADRKLYAGDAANQSVLVNTPSSGGGGGGNANISEYATETLFPATGSSGTLYIATDESRVFRWDTSGVYIELGTSGGGGGSSSSGMSSLLASIIFGS
jgi:hypothetical protein